MAYQKELILLKPGVRNRKIIGRIISRFEDKGLDLLALKLMKPTKSQLQTLYSEHKGKSFYNSLISYMVSDVITAMVVGGENAIAICRGLVGATNPLHSLPGSIRGDFALTMPDNIAHASDTTANALREIKIFFSAREIHQ